VIDDILLRILSKGDKVVVATHDSSKGVLSLLHDIYRYDQNFIVRGNKGVMARRSRKQCE
jgi:hypothetical protein